MEREHAFSESDVRLLQTLANSMSVALENARLFDETQRRTRETAALAEVGRDISSTLDLPTVMDRIARHAKDLLNADSSAIFLPDAGGGQLSRDRRGRRHRASARGNGHRAGRGHHRQPGAKRPRRVHQRHAARPARRADRGHGAGGRRAADGGAAAGRKEGQGRHGGVADVRRAVRRQPARIPGRPVAAGHGRDRERAALRRIGEARDANLRRSTRSRSSSRASSTWPPLLDLVGEQIRTVFKADIAYVALYNPQTGIIDFPYQHGDDLKPLKYRRGPHQQDHPFRQAADHQPRGGPARPRAGRQGRRQAGALLSGRADPGGRHESWRHQRAEHAEGRHVRRRRRAAACRRSRPTSAWRCRMRGCSTRRRRRSSHQTATADILRVISSSPTDVQPVFDAIVGTAVRLLACDFTACCASTATRFSPVAAATPGGVPVDMGIAMCVHRSRRELPVARHRRQSRCCIYRTGRRSTFRRTSSAIHELTAINSSLMLPLMRRASASACWPCARQGRRFSDKEIALAKFVRRPGGDRHRERAPLQRDEGSARAADRHGRGAAGDQRIDGRSQAGFRQDPRQLRAAVRRRRTCPCAWSTATNCEIGAYRGGFNDEVVRTFPRPLAGTISDMTLRQGSVLHRDSVAAAMDLPEYAHEFARKVGDFSVANAPMWWEGRGIGTIDIACRPPRPFSEAELALLKTFADQAVIAIQNARLFNETKEALERQTATAEVLKVISESPTDVQPVFDIIAERAAQADRRRVGDRVPLRRRAGSTLRARTASSPNSWPSWLATIPTGSDARFISAEAIRGGVVVNVPDLQLRAEAGDGVPQRTEGASPARQGCAAACACRCSATGRCVGAIAMYREQDRASSPTTKSTCCETFAEPGGHRDRERAPLQRDAGGARAADRDVGCAAGDQRVADRRAAGVRHHRRARGGADQRALLPRDAARRRHVAAGGPARRQRSRHRCAARGVAAAPAAEHDDFGARNPRAPRRQRGRPPCAVRRRVRAGHEARLRARRLPQRPVGAASARPAGDRRHHRQPRRDGPLRRQGNGVAADLRAPGGGGRSRTFGCSTKRARRWSSRPRPPKCCRSSAARWRTPRRCSRRSSTAASACLRASSSRSCCCATTAACMRQRGAARRSTALVRDVGSMPRGDDLDGAGDPRAAYGPGRRQHSRPARANPAVRKRRRGARPVHGHL